MIEQDFILRKPVDVKRHTEETKLCLEVVYSADGEITGKKNDP